MRYAGDQPWPDDDPNMEAYLAGVTAERKRCAKVCRDRAAVHRQRMDASPHTKWGELAISIVLAECAEAIERGDSGGA